MTELNDPLEAELKLKYQKILEDNGIQGKICKLTVTKPSMKGTHFGSLIDMVRIEFEQPGLEPLDLFVKKRLPTTEMDAAMAEMASKVVLKEGYFLKDFYVELQRLCVERVGSSQVIDGLLPRTFYYDVEKIVMENLVSRGYEILNRRDRHDFDHARLVIENLARLHGVSHVLIEKEGGYLKFLETHPHFEQILFKSRTTGYVAKVFVDLERILLETGKTAAKDKVWNILQKFKGQLTPHWFENVTVDTLFYTVNHSDCWNNNIMFEGPGPKHDKLILVDFQMLRVGSPIFDLAGYIYTSTKSEVRQEWRGLLKIYFEKLQQIVTSLGGPFNLKFEDFVTDFVRKSKLGFLHGISIMIGLEVLESHDTEKEGYTYNEDRFKNLMTQWMEKETRRVEEVCQEIISCVYDYQLLGDL